MFFSYRCFVKYSFVVGGILSFLGSCKPREFNQSATENAVDISGSPEKCEWSLRETNVFKAWEILAAKGMKSPGAGVTIGLMDVGIYLDPTTKWVHPELSRVKIDFERSWNHITDEQGAYAPAESEGSWGHGSLTAALIGSPRGRAQGMNYPGGISGVSPGVTILPARVGKIVALAPGWTTLVPGLAWATKKTGLDITESTSGTLAKGIRWAVDKGVQVISISMGTVTETPGLWNAVKYARDNGVIVVASTGHAKGNSSKDVRLFVQPGKYGEAIGVTGSDTNHHVWANSVAGKGIDTAAPAAPMCYPHVERTDKNLPAVPTKWGIFTGEGTTFSTAQVAGITALWIQYHGYENLVKKYGKQNIQKLYWNVLTKKGRNQPAGWDTSKFGPGIIDAAKLLTAELPEPKDLETPP